MRQGVLPVTSTSTILDARSELPHARHTGKSRVSEKTNAATNSSSTCENGLSDLQVSPSNPQGLEHADPFAHEQDPESQM